MKDLRLLSMSMLWPSVLCDRLVSLSDSRHPINSLNFNLQTLPMCGCSVCFQLTKTLITLSTVLFVFSRDLTNINQMILRMNKNMKISMQLPVKVIEILFL